MTNSSLIGNLFSFLVAYKVYLPVNCALDLINFYCKFNINFIKYTQHFSGMYSFFREKLMLVFNKGKSESKQLMIHQHLINFLKLVR